MGARASKDGYKNSCDELCELSMMRACDLTCDLLVNELSYAYAYMTGRIQKRDIDDSLAS